MRALAINMAIEHRPFIDPFPITTSISLVNFLATFDYQRAYIFF